MKTKLALLFCLVSFTAFGQFNIAANAGYTFHTGPHHSDYENTLLDKSNYDEKKMTTFSSSLKLAYAFKNLNFGLGADYGNYQTKTETQISGLGSDIIANSFVAAGGRYLAPNVFANYKANISRKLTFQAGVITGILCTGFEKDNGILVIKTQTLLGIIPGQTIGAAVHSGKLNKITSTNLVSGIQVELGYNISNKLNLNFEAAVRKSSVDAHASLLGYEQPFKYDLWYFPARIGLRYTFYKMQKVKTKNLKNNFRKNFNG